MTIPCPTYIDRGSAEPALVFLHGIGSDQESFVHQLDHFSGRRRCLSWTMPGYGASPPLDDLTFDALADAVAVMLDDAGLERVILVGHSMGGMIGQTFAVRHSDRLAALVASCTSAAFGSADGSFQEKFLAARLKPLDEGKTPADLAPGLVSAMFGADAPVAAHDNATRSTSAITAEAYRAVLHCLVTFNGRDNLSAIACPTLVLAAERDATAPPKGMKRMADAIPNAVYAEIPGAGHLANLEAPDGFNAAIDAFLRDLEA